MEEKMVREVPEEVRAELLRRHEARRRDEISLGLHPIATSAHLEAVMAGIPDGSLSDCKFCGGAPGLGHQRALMSVWIECQTCGASAARIGISLDPTVEELKTTGRKAAEAWGRSPDQ